MWIINAVLQSGTSLSERYVFCFGKLKLFLATAVATAITIVLFGFNQGQNLAAGRAFEFVDFGYVAFVNIYGFAASGAFELEAFAAVTAVAIVIAIVAITAIVIAIAAIVVAAIEIFFNRTEILVDFFDVIVESSGFVFEILNRKREIL